MFSRIWTKPYTKSCSEQIERLKAALQDCDAVVIGAGAGLSTSAGFVYTGERFEKYFSDFAAKYGIKDMYSGGFYPFAMPEEHWSYWSRYIYINRYMDAPKPVYDDLLKLVSDKDYFVITAKALIDSGVYPRRLKPDIVGIRGSSQPDTYPFCTNSSNFRLLITVKPVSNPTARWLVLLCSFSLSFFFFRQ